MIAIYCGMHCRSDWFEPFMGGEWQGISQYLHVVQQSIRWALDNGIELEVLTMLESGGPTIYCGAIVIRLEDNAMMFRMRFPAIRPMDRGNLETMLAEGTLMPLSEKR